MQAIRTVEHKEMEGMVVIPVSLNWFTQGR
jgi:hypothetical protein